MKTLKGWTAALLLLTAVAAAPSALAQIEPPEKPFNVTLRVATFPGTWTEAIRKEIGTALTKAGITLEFVGGNSSEFLAKLVTARGRSVPFDVIEIGDDTYPDFRAADFLEKIDHGKIPNLSKVDRSLFDDYIVSNWLSEPSIVYNADKFKEAGIPAPKRFSDLANPALKGRVLFPDITSYNVYYLITALARENGGNEADATAGFDMIKKIAPHSAVSKSGTVAQLFQTGEVWAAIWGAHIGQRIAQSGINISVAHPTVKNGDVAIARGFLGIAKGSPNKAAAEYYINAILTKGVQAQFSTEYGMIPVTTEARAVARSESGKDKTGTPYLKLGDEEVAKAWWPDYSAIDKRDWARRFQRALTN